MGGEGKENGTEGRRGPNIQPPPWASQNLGLALTPTDQIEQLQEGTTLHANVYRR